MTPYEARRLAAELHAAADAIEPPPQVTSKPPLGWTFKHHLVVDLGEAAVVDTIVELYLLGRSYTDIIGTLNARGLHTKNGRPWKLPNFSREMTRLRRAGIVDPADHGRLAVDQLPLPDAG